MLRCISVTGVVILAAVLCVPGCAEKRRRQVSLPPGPELLLGQQAPDVQRPDLEGKSLRLSDFKGKVVVLSFWAQF